MQKNPKNTILENYAKHIALEKRTVAHSEVTLLTGRELSNETKHFTHRILSNQKMSSQKMGIHSSPNYTAFYYYIVVHYSFKTSANMLSTSYTFEQNNSF